MEKKGIVLYIILFVAISLLMIIHSGRPIKINGQQSTSSITYSPEVRQQPKANNGYCETGMASWYGNQHRGLKMANGRKFDPNKVSFAHKDLPINSILIVTNLDNGESIKGPLTDRGPYIRFRVIDVSERAAKLLKFKRKGIARVKIRLIKNSI